MLALRAAPGADRLVELREVPDPDLAPNEALVRVCASSLNAGEARFAQQAPADWRPGSDVSGYVVHAAIDGSGPSIGTRVVGLVQNGAWAELAAIPTRWLAPIPDNVGYTDAATLPIAGQVAFRALSIGGLLLGKDVLVTGASGGVGQFAVQLGAISGARVTASVSRSERAREIQSLGATEAIVGLPPAGSRFDLVIDAMAGPFLAAAVMSLRPGGTIVSFGTSSREPSTFDLNDLNGASGGRTLYYGFDLFQELEQRNTVDRDLAALARLIGNGRLKPLVSLVTSWHEADATMRALLDRRIQGKAVFSIS
jgi:NADPH:quinone reductase-like Zn-dependent oxidoreductase